MKRNPSCFSCKHRAQTIFSLLDEQECAEVEKIKKFMKFRKGQAVDFKSETSCGFFCIQSGYFKMKKQEGNVHRTSRICGLGDIIGYGNWIDDSKRNHKVVSGDVSSACFFPQEQFIELQRKSLRLSEGIINQLCKVVSDKRDLLVASGRASVRSRVIAVLVILAEKFGQRVEKGMLISIKIDRSTIASLAGTSVESLARILTDLVQERNLIRDRRQIIIPDLAGLKK